MEENYTLSGTEAQQFAEFKKRINQQAAQAQISKLEYHALTATADKATLKRVCQEASSLKLGGVCVLPSAVRLCAGYLSEQPSPLLIACISYPHGGDVTKIKVKAIKEALSCGADEVEVTAPVASVKNGDWGAVRRELKKLKRAARQGAIRINIEADLLTQAETSKLCNIVSDCGIPSVRIASGVYGADFRPESVTLVKSVVKDRCTVKISGVNSFGEMETALGMGAEIIGSKCASDLARIILKNVQ